jgi:hypothetical protein
LYIRNFEAGRWPAGDPNTHQSVGQYGDVDNSITKFLIMQDSLTPYFKMAFGKRPKEELYVLSADPYNLTNVANDEKYGQVLAKFRTSLSEWMRNTGDRRYLEPQTKFWDEAWYTPDYQFSDFNLSEELSAFRMLRRDGSGSFAEYPCTP